MLTPKDSIDNYREASAEDKAAWEAAHPEGWAPELPSPEFRAMCKAHGIAFNDSTGYYELNGLKDLTLADVMLILRDYKEGQSESGTHLPGIRTNVPTNIHNGWTGHRRSMRMAFYRSRAEVLRTSSESVDYQMADCANCFSGCGNLRRLIVPIHLSEHSSNTQSMFKGCVNLEDVRFTQLPEVLDLSDSPKISLASWQYTVENTTVPASKTATIKVHADVFAKLTDEGNPEWSQLMADAAAKNISFAKP